MLKKLLLGLLVFAVFLLHQDCWNWRDARLVFGLLPAGLAYQAAYALGCAAMMAVLVKFAWPARLDRMEPPPPAEEERKP
jgi:hypothetical protein